MKNRILILLGLLLLVVVIHAQEDDYIVLKGKTLTLPFHVNKTYGAWTTVETKTKISPAELTFRQKDADLMKAAAEFDKDPKLTLQKANIDLLKCKNAVLGVTIYFYSYKEIPGYLSLSGKSMHELWMSRIKPNSKTLINLSDYDYSDYAASKGEGTIEGKPLSFFFTAFAVEESNMVVIYTVSKQNASKNIMFFGDTFGRDWDTGMMLEEGH